MESVLYQRFTDIYSASIRNKYYTNRITQLILINVPRVSIIYIVISQ